MAVTVVNMIPNSLSNETNRDSEPNLAINPANRLQLVGSAFTPDPLSSGSGPVFVSNDGGNTWVLSVVLPGGNRTGDTSLRFAGTSNILYAGILRFDNGNLNILRKSDVTVPGLMTILVDRANEDQPYVEAATVFGGGGTGQDRVYIGSNDTSQRLTTGHTATIDQSLDAATAPAPAGFGPTRVEARATATLPGGMGNQDGPSIRPAIHPNGTIYGAYFGWRTFGSPVNTTDVVVVRDDNWGTGATPFMALVDPGDMLPGVRVVTGVSVPALTTLLGTQRIGSHLAIAVDPRDSQTVYLAWADGTSASNYTIHVRRSTNGGAAWTADLRAIAPATNPGLAITEQGKVGFLYQKLVNPGSGNRWETHLEISSDGFASPPTDIVLANVPDSNGSYPGPNPIGDYACLLAMGKDFYGVFSANNTPDNANFPNGVTYWRIANWATHTLLGVDNVTPVAVSIDPFFFKAPAVDVGEDFYVRDWTDSAASGDTGVEPSTHSVFYATSDVWNQRTSAVPSFNANDQPNNEDPGNGLGAAGDNIALARIRRNAGGAATNVTANFLYSEFGTGSNYVAIGAATPVSFAAGDTGPHVATLPWHLNPTTSTHLCLAVETSTPADPFVPPSLVGNTPGWWTGTDLRVLNDNNKAQRNMGVLATLMDASGSGIFYAIVHNGANFKRDIALRYEALPDVQQRLGRARIVAIGERDNKPTSRAFKSGDTLTLENMESGENRWVGLSFDLPKGQEGELLPVFFHEMLGDALVNGFAIAMQPATLDAIIRSNLALHRAVFARLFTAFGIEQAREESQAAGDLLRSGDISDQTYIKILQEHIKSMSASVSELRKSQGSGDPFGVQGALRDLDKAAASGQPAVAAPAHTALLHKLDPFVTMLQKAQGDLADILQNVRWQRELFSRLPELHDLNGADRLVERSQAFILTYGERKVGNDDYPRLISELLNNFREMAAQSDLRNLGLEADVTAMEQHLDSPAMLQKAHRGLLLKLQSLVT